MRFFLNLVEMGYLKCMGIILVWAVALGSAQQAMMKPGKYRIENLADALVSMLFEF